MASYAPAARARPWPPSKRRRDRWSIPGLTEEALLIRKRGSAAPTRLGTAAPYVRPRHARLAAPAVRGFGGWRWLPPRCHLRLDSAPPPGPLLHSAARSPQTPRETHPTAETARGGSWRRWNDRESLAPTPAG